MVGAIPQILTTEMKGTNSINISEIPANLYFLALLGNQCFWKIWKEKGFFECEPTQGSC